MRRPRPRASRTPSRACDTLSQADRGLALNTRRPLRSRRRDPRACDAGWARYRFLTTWLLDAPVEPVWDADLRHRRVAVAGGRASAGSRSSSPRGEDGVGGVSRFTFRSVLPVRPRVRDAIRAGRAASAARGSRVGRARRRRALAVLRAATASPPAVYEWNVETTARWMNLLGPRRPVRRSSGTTTAIMRAGGEGLARLLSAPGCSPASCVDGAIRLRACEGLLRRRLRPSRVRVVASGAEQASLRAGAASRGRRRRPRPARSGSSRA